MVLMGQVIPVVRGLGPMGDQEDVEAISSVLSKWAHTLKHNLFDVGLPSLLLSHSVISDFCNHLAHIDSRSTTTGWSVCLSGLQ